MARCGVCMDFTDAKASKVLEHAGACVDPEWVKIAEARKGGLHDKAARIFRKLFGLAEPMTDEAKAKLKAYAELHKDEIAYKAKVKRALRRMVKDLMVAQPRRKS